MIAPAPRRRPLDQRPGTTIPLATLIGAAIVGAAAWAGIIAGILALIPEASP